ncbi:N-acetyltransferase [Isoptericola variabilis]|uniref:GCN5-related N-acetyltransferase n=1 Tax=Isoptericola variabilis (strain 225) TaxID=743718 RepID=F6FUG1_ISOV2|nr:GNAT family N-acetyltransferase [Isoptericola variabilis]AEG44289.1 GCN5-related N-acetyltransferase [Isoptericola variabilis 225]TWH28871.1 Acetyltransferases [Isoptericola variabilis J7]
MIRPYRAGDRDAVAEVCVRTAAAGGDARGLYSDDLLMPEVYALPYVTYAPDLAFVVVHPDGAPAGTGHPGDAGDERLRVEDGRLVGYVIGVADTADFVAWWEREWAPGFVRRHPEPGPPLRPGAAPSYPETALLRDGRTPRRMLLPDDELAAYPAHLHIDLLPEAQRRGYGRRLVDTLRTALAARGVPGVHLGYDPANTAARAFYDRVGFRELPSHRPAAPFLGIPTR